MKYFTPSLKALFQLSFLFSTLFLHADDCDLDFSYSNTGSNMIIMVNDDALQNDVLQNGDLLGAFMYLNDAWQCVGFIDWTSEQQTLAVWGNDTGSGVQDGMMATEPVVLKAKSNGVIYDVSYAPEIAFEVNGIAVLGTNLSFVPVCDDEGNVYGCTNNGYEEFNPSATKDDGSCQTPGMVYGCTISSYVEYNPLATVFDNSCSTLCCIRMY